MNKILVGLFLFLSVWMATFSKTAAACEAPAAFCSASCTAGGTNAICPAPVGGVWTCNLTNNGDTMGGEGTIVINFDGAHATDYSAYGHTATGAAFKCILPDPTGGVTQIQLFGSAEADYLSFLDPVYGQNLSPAGASLTATLQGSAGNDDIDGSDFFGAGYSEVLNGGDDDDTIYGHAGDDEIHGGPGVDHLFGGPGNDTISGGDDGDFIDGNDGDDTLFGDHGDDVICDSSGNDDLMGGDGDDTLFSVGGALTTVTGGVGTGDWCGDCAIVACSASCDTQIFTNSPPGTCP